MLASAVHFDDGMAVEVDIIVLVLETTLTCLLLSVDPSSLVLPSTQQIVPRPFATPLASLLVASRELTDFVDQEMRQVEIDGRLISLSSILLQ